jgi:hypothetical protein
MGVNQETLVIVFSKSDLAFSRPLSDLIHESDIYA